MKTNQMKDINNMKEEMKIQNKLYQQSLKYNQD